MLNSSPSTLFSNTFSIFYEDNNNIASTNLTSDEIVNPYYYCYDNLQSPMFYYDIENYADFLSNNHDLITMIQQPLTAATNSSIVTDETKDNSSSKGDEVMNEVVIKPSSNNATCRGTKRRRTSNKDRHSKIRTAHGLRDRRMRLSLEVARPFFRLQDMLGFDKASRTVEWLLTQSKIAIEELLQSKNIGSDSGVTKCTISSTSDCEGESIVVEQKDHKGNPKHEILASSTNNNNNKGKKRGSVAANVVKEKRMRTTKEAMKKARDKARKRTLEKKLSKSIVKDDANSSHSSLTLGANFEMMGRENNISHSRKDWNSLTDLFQ